MAQPCRMEGAGPGSLRCTTRRCATAVKAAETPVRSQATCCQKASSASRTLLFVPSRPIPMWLAVLPIPRLPAGFHSSYGLAQGPLHTGAIAGVQSGSLRRQGYRERTQGLPLPGRELTASSAGQPLAQSGPANVRRVVVYARLPLWWNSNIQPTVCPRVLQCGKCAVEGELLRRPSRTWPTAGHCPSLCY